MNEAILHFIWKYKPYVFNGLKTTNNEPIEVIDAGEYNSNAGPDFFNAKVKVGNTLWAGNVEMHINSSDWFNHNHQTDKNYDNVILHVVVNNDKQTVTSLGSPIPTLQIKYPSEIEAELIAITNSGNWIPCANRIQSVNPFTVKSWVEKMMVERLEHKTELVNQSVKDCNGNWEEAFYRSVVRCFGLKVNALPAEMLAKNTPLKVLAKQKDNLFQVEAILFGQTGLLDNAETEDEYQLSLRIEYNYLQKKFNLTPIDGSLWKFLRMRPAAFPTIRIAQLAMLIHKSSSLFSKLIEVESYAAMVLLLTVNTSEYWETHYTFGNKSTKQNKQLGSQTIETIVLNSVIPFMFAYGESRGKPELKEKALSLLEKLPAEKNSTLDGFRRIGFEAQSAFDSQALLYLKTNFCDTRKCIFCNIGSSILLKSNISL
ncbi:MAG TPA: DUF2851 family protein [Tenuifilaceae bacterium]|nr:DUF2851 family protein [Tenuifilaceae bacterium]HPN22125.1 DUF2851 family protein [Tenuifilaceae bacterium]HPV56051.1 DUF2851 family protein [Tenuifilaceae bacterium]